MTNTQISKVMDRKRGTENGGTKSKKKNDEISKSCIVSTVLRNKSFSNFQISMDSLIQNLKLNINTEFPTKENGFHKVGTTCSFTK